MVKFYFTLKKLGKGAVPRLCGPDTVAVECGSMVTVEKRPGSKPWENEDRMTVIDGEYRNGTIGLQKRFTSLQPGTIKRKRACGSRCNAKQKRVVLLRNCKKRTRNHPSSNPKSPVVAVPFTHMFAIRTHATIYCRYL